MSPYALLRPFLRNTTAILVVVLFFGLASIAPASAADSAPTVNKSTTAAPRELSSPQALLHNLNSEQLIFIENRGQFDSRVRFQVKGNGGTLWLTDDGIVFDFVRPKQGTSPSSSTLGRQSNPKDKLPEMERLVFKQKFVRASANSTVEAREPLPGINNYFLGSDANKWRSHVRGYAEVIFRDVWTGIDLKLSGNGPNLEEEFIVHPGADASAVQLAYDGIDGLKMQDDGSLKVATAFGDVIETSPRIYQESLGKTRPVSGKFKVAGNSYSFEVAKRDELSDLIIDPTVIYSKPRDGKKAGQGSLLYSSFLGGSQYDIGNAIAVDNAGNAYVTGQTNSTDFPTTPGVFQGSGTGVFVTKINALGSAPLVYSTYLVLRPLDYVTKLVSGMLACERPLDGNPVAIHPTIPGPSLLAQASDVADPAFA